MTRSEREVARALELGRRGRSPTEISRQTGIPRRTVNEWVNGRQPKRPRRACAACGHEAHDRQSLPASYVYLLGVYLGDGCLSRHARGVYKLRVVLDAIYPRIIDEVVAAAEAVRPTNRTGCTTRYALDSSGERYASCVEVYSYSRSWPCLLPQHGPGKKHERLIELAGWQKALISRHPELLLRGLVHSDGCRFLSTGRGGWAHPRYVFSNRSADIRHIFCGACDVVGLHYTTSRHLVYVSRKADVARMDEFIGPKA